MEKETLENVLEQVVEVEGESQKWLDPGQAEGEKKDPKVEQEKITADHPRFKEIYGKMKEFERLLAEKDEIIKGALSHNEKLVNRIDTLANKAIDTIDNSKKEIIDFDEQIREVKSKKKEALKVFDYDQAEEYDELLSNLRAAKKDAERAPKKPVIDHDAEETVNAFIESHEWFRSDPIMAAAMERLDSIYANAPKWKNKPMAERLEAAAKEIEKKFHYTSVQEEKFPSEPKKYRHNDVEGHTGNDTRSSVKLTEAQVKIARGLGIPIDEYARQLKLVGGA